MIFDVKLSKICNFGAQLRYTNVTHNLVIITMGTTSVGGLKRGILLAK